MNPRDKELLIEYAVRDDDEQATEAAPAPEIIALKKQRDELLIVLKQAHRFLRKNGYDMTDIDAIIAKVEDKS